jgi:hypothetical protein
MCPPSRGKEVVSGSEPCRNPRGLQGIGQVEVTPLQLRIDPRFWHILPGAFPEVLLVTLFVTFGRR